MPRISSFAARLVVFGIAAGCALAAPGRSGVEGLYVIPAEIRGYQNERLKLENGRFRYWFSGDVVVVDEKGRDLNRTKYPIHGSFRVDGHRIVFSNSEVEDRYIDIVNGVQVLWRLGSKRIWERQHKIYDYGVLIRVAASGADAESPSIRVLYDAEMRKKHKEWRDPFVHGPQ